MKKRISTFLLTIMLNIGILLSAMPMRAQAMVLQVDEIHPIVMIATSEDEESFAATGMPLSIPPTDEYYNDPPEDVDTVDEKAAGSAEQCRATGITDSWEIALWLHNWLIFNANYDYSYTIYGADGVLLKGTGVCNSYMLAYAVLLDEFDIENICIVSMEMNHGWNLVKLNNQWCHVDCTWDDPGEGGYENWSYFGIDDDLMGRDHYWDTSEYPVCSSKDNYYSIRTGGNVFSNKAELIDLLCQLAEAKTERMDCIYIGSDPNLALLDIFKEWFYTYNWKYGLTGYWGTYSDFDISFQISYSDPWEKPENFEENHTHCYMEETTQPSCTQNGQTVYTCSCGHSYSSILVATGHTYDNDQDTVCNVCNEQRDLPSPPDIGPTIPMYRLYNPNSGEHFYTGSEEERDILVAAGWIYEGIAWNAPVKTGSPIYRLFNPNSGDHHYTGSKEERDFLVSVGWIYEHVAWNTLSPNDYPQYRMYNPNADIGSHHYTGSTEERDFLVSVGWIYEGIGWYGAPN